MPIQIGTVLRGRYRIDAVLSEHAHGGVYRVYDLETNDACVVKEFLYISKDDFTSAARELLPRIHPNLASVMGYFSLDEEHHYLVMEYVRGESLAELSSRLGALSEQEALARVSQVLVALDYLHTRTSSVLHCDVNPSNILITPEDLTVLVGYSIGGTLGPSATATLVAPEHMAGNPEVASDVYAAGATLYFALTAELPGRQEGGWTDRFSIEPLHRIDARLSLELSGVVEKSMQYRANDRYENVREFRKALGRVVARTEIGEEIRLEEDLHDQSAYLAWRLPVLIAALAIGMGVLAYSKWDLLLKSPDASPPTVVVVAKLPESSPTIIPPAPSEVPTSTIAPSETLTPTAVAQIIPSSTSRFTYTPLPSVTSVPSTATSLPPTETPRPTPTLGIGSTFISDDDGALLVYVPHGEFVVGSSWDDRLAMEDEHPQQIVYLSAFWIDATEVTNSQYQNCVIAGNCSPPMKVSSATRTRYFNNAEYDEYPVIWVDWLQATSYCEWAGRRLPTDVEWEKAARGTDGRKYPWGDEPANLLLVTGEARANFASISGDTTRVGAYPSGASPYGAKDMSGNVAEWVADFYRSHYYQYVQWLTATLEAPSRFRGGQHGVRNGSWNGSLINVRAAYRGFTAGNNYASHNLGFRCALTTLP